MLVVVVQAFACPVPAPAQVAPSSSEVAAYRGLFAAAAQGDTQRLHALLREGENPNARDGYGRAPLHVAAYARQPQAFRTLVAGGADPNALERDRYDIITIAAVANDVPTLRAALDAGCSARNVTSRYDGTALIAAAHLGHADVVRTLIRAGAPVDHVNNLGWTAVIEAIVLGDGGPRYVGTLDALVRAGANLDIADRAGRTPLVLAQERGYATMIHLLRRGAAAKS